MEEAEQKGLKKFTPAGVRARRRELRALLRRRWARRCASSSPRSGYERAQDLVGRSDLLVQARATPPIDLHEMIRPLEEMLDLEPIDMPGAAEEEREAAGLIVAQPDPHARRRFLGGPRGARADHLCRDQNYHPYYSWISSLVNRWHTQG